MLLGWFANGPDILKIEKYTRVCRPRTIRLHDAKSRIVRRELDMQRDSTKLWKPVKGCLEDGAEFADRHVFPPGTVEQLQSRVLRSLDMAAAIDPGRVGMPDLGDMIAGANVAISRAEDQSRIAIQLLQIGLQFSEVH